MRFEVGQRYKAVIECEVLITERTSFDGEDYANCVLFGHTIRDVPIGKVHITDKDTGAFTETDVEDINIQLNGYDETCYITARDRTE